MGQGGLQKMQWRSLLKHSQKSREKSGYKEGGRRSKQTGQTASETAVEVVGMLRSRAKPVDERGV
jgi:hypothetical protein